MDIGYLLDASWSPAVAANTQKYHYLLLAGLTGMPPGWTSAQNCR